MSSACSAYVSCAVLYRELDIANTVSRMLFEWHRRMELWGSGRGKAEREFVFTGKCVSVARVRGRQ